MSKFIWTERHLTDGETHLTERTAVAGEPPEGFQRFQCKIRAPLGKDMSTGNVLKIDGQFFFDAETVEAAFDMAPGLIAKHTAKLQRTGRSELHKAAIDHAVADAKRMVASGAKLKMG